MRLLVIFYCLQFFTLLQFIFLFFIFCVCVFFYYFFCFIFWVLCCLARQYALTLVASDGRNENSTTVIIHINDVNDLPPVFERSSYTTLVQEELPGPHPYGLIQVLVFFFFVFFLHPTYMCYFEIKAQCLWKLFI